MIINVYNLLESTRIYLYRIYKCKKLLLDISLDLRDHLIYTIIPYDYQLCVLVMSILYYHVSMFKFIIKPSLKSVKVVIWYYGIMVLWYYINIYIYMFI